MMNLKNIIVYDLEIKNLVSPPAIKWTDFEKMGISCGCAYYYLDDSYRIFMGDNLTDLVKDLNECELVVTFNGIHFDNPLLRASSFALAEESKLRHYDIYAESRAAVLRDAPDNIHTRPHGLRLDDHMKAMFGQGKKSDGILAPLYYQRGELGKLLTYCLGDVAGTKKIFDHIAQHGTVKTDTYGTKTVRQPFTNL